MTTNVAFSLLIGLPTILVSAFSTPVPEFAARSICPGAFFTHARRGGRKTTGLSKAWSTAGDDGFQRNPPVTPWASRALLISSFTDGIVQSPPAQEFLQQSLVASLVSERQQEAENAVESSVLQSPCCGPDLDALDELDTADEVAKSIQQHPDQIENVLEQLKDGTLRFLYVPTAMYALRADSNNTPGKQRQRARADGKKRRNQIVKHLNKLLPGVQILTVTLDLDDGSIKQPDGSDDSSDFPKVCIE